MPNVLNTYHHYWQVTVGSSLDYLFHLCLLEFLDVCLIGLGVIDQFLSDFFLIDSFSHGNVYGHFYHGSVYDHVHYHLVPPLFVRVRSRAIRPCCCHHLTIHHSHCIPSDFLNNRFEKFMFRRERRSYSASPYHGKIDDE